MSHHKPKVPGQTGVSARGLIFVSVVGIVLCLWGAGAAYYENALFRAQYGHVLDYGLIVDVYPSRYPGFVLLGGLFLIGFVALTVGRRLLRKLYRRARPELKR